MNTTKTGRFAEDAAAKYLINLGYEIIYQNWRNRWCEIDIIAKKENKVYFVEVKFRSNAISGSGVEYITNSKLLKMARGAEIWVNRFKWAGDYSVSTIEVSGTNFRVSEFIEDLDII